MSVWDRLGTIIGSFTKRTGVAGSLASTRLLQSLLFETDARNPVMTIAAVFLTLAACFAACYFPVRRATRIDPCSLLHAE